MPTGTPLMGHTTLDLLYMILNAISNPVHPGVPRGFY